MSKYILKQDNVGGALYVEYVINDENEINLYLSQSMGMDRKTYVRLSFREIKDLRTSLINFDFDLAQKLLSYEKKGIKDGRNPNAKN